MCSVTVVPMMRVVPRDADFPDAFRANLWVRGLSKDKSAEEALSDFRVHSFHKKPKRGTHKAWRITQGFISMAIIACSSLWLLDVTTDRSHWLKAWHALLQCVSAMQRFPTWMWCNKSVKRFLEWLRDYNLQVCV